MLETHLNSPITRGRLHTGLAADHIDAFADWLHLNGGKREEAIHHWKMAIELDPNHSESLYYLARALEQLHKPEAKQYRDRYEALQRRPLVIEQVKKLGNLALDAANGRNWPEAVAQLRKALELCGQCSEIAHLHKDLGLIYCRSGAMEMGEREFQTALELNPNDEDVLKALQVLQGLQNDKKKKNPR